MKPARVSNTVFRTLLLVIRWLLMVSPVGRAGEDEGSDGVEASGVR